MNRPTLPVLPALLAFLVFTGCVKNTGPNASRDAETLIASAQAYFNDQVLPGKPVFLLVAHLIWSRLSKFVNDAPNVSSARCEIFTDHDFQQVMVTVNGSEFRSLSLIAGQFTAKRQMRAL